MRFGVAWPGEERALGRPCSRFPAPKGGYRRAGGGLLTRTCSDKGEWVALNLKSGHKEGISARMVKHWSRLPREAISVPSLEMFKPQDGALSNPA